MTGDVFEKVPLGGAFPDDAGNLGPEVAGIIGATAFASGTEGLTRISGEEDVEGATERSAIETAQIVTDRGRGKVFSALGSDENAAGICFPFDEGARVKPGFGEHEAQIQASAARAEGQSVPGT